MKIFNKYSIVTVLVAFFVLGLIGPTTAFAVTTATTPSLGAAATYGVLSDTYTNTNAVNKTTINGDVGFTTGPAVVPLGGHPSVTYPNYGVAAPYPQAGLDQATALTALNAGVNAACDVTFAVGAIDLSISNAPQHIGTTYIPGVYCIDGAMSIDSVPGITLSGAGTYIFRSTGALNVSAGMTVTLAGGASACDVFWNPNGATTIGANNNFIGTVIPTLAAAHDITVLSTTLWTGRALTFGHTVTTPDANVVITVPTCAVAASTQLGSGQQPQGTLTIVKRVINDNSRENTPSDFSLFVDGNGRSSVESGHSNNFYASDQGMVYTVSETADPEYTLTFSGDCDSTGHVSLYPNDNKFCILTNDDIGAPVVAPVPPLIDMVKTASPLSLPAGPGSVVYTYTLRNVGTVPVTNITIVGDTCSPIILVSGDINTDAKLDLNETWVYTCTQALSATHTNTAVATGWANGISAVDIASAMVIVGTPIVPPLIHLTKVPSPLTLPAGGGMVTYTKRVTNPGTVALSNVRVTDDKCSPLTYISGDTNGDSKLDATETWTYTCRINITKTTTNTAIASGEANGLTARDFALATIIVASPKLPNTGIAPDEKSTPWNIVVLTGILMLVSISLVAALRKRTI